MIVQPEHGIILSPVLCIGGHDISSCLSPLKYTPGLIVYPDHAFLILSGVTGTMVVPRLSKDVLVSFSLSTSSACTPKLSFVCHEALRIIAIATVSHILSPNPVLLIQEVSRTCANVSPKSCEVIQEMIMFFMVRGVDLTP